MTQPNKPAALDAVAWMYQCNEPIVDYPNVTVIRWLQPIPDNWTETPLTDLNKAQKRIDRLGARVAKLERELDRASTRFEHYAAMIEQGFKGDGQ